MDSKKETESLDEITPKQIYLMYGTIFLSFPALLTFTEKSDLRLIESVFYCVSVGLIFSGFIGSKFKNKFFSGLTLSLLGFVTSLVFVIIFYSLDK